MTTYIVLVNWTERGVAQVKESPRRLDAAKTQGDGRLDQIRVSDDG
jgi:uncharacterized protein with GYD domain